MKRVLVRLDAPVPLDARQDLHDAGARQLDGRHWSLRWRGSGDLLAHLDAMGLGPNEVDTVPPAKAPVSPFVLQVTPWMDCEEER